MRRGVPALQPLKLPPVHRSRLDNGLEVLVVRHGESRIATARLVVRAGTSADPKGKEGLADLTAQLLRRGSRRRSAEAIDEAVEFVGGTLSVGAGPDWLAVRVSGPVEHLAPLLAVLAEVVREPRFESKEVESARERNLAELASDRDDPATIADKAIARHLWGAHPYGGDGSGTLTSVARLGRDDVVGFHRSRVGPRVAALTVVGLLDPKRTLAQVRRTFDGWQGGPAAPPELAPPRASAGAGKVLVLDGPKLTQSQVRIAWRSVERLHPETMALRLVNHTLGGSFTSRLVREARVRGGLTYGISSHIEWLAHAASQEIATSTRTAETRRIIDVALTQVASLKARGPTAAELTAAQRYFVGVFPSTVERGDSIAARLGDIWLYGLGDDWIAAYRQRIAEVTHREAVHAARGLLAQHPPAIVVVGDASKIVPRLKSLGPLSVEKLADFE